MTDLEKTTQILHRALGNISNSMIDNYIQKNVEFRAEAGLSEKIIRTSSGHCCEWCDKVAGTYKYPDVPKDVYRRHDNCDCTVEYVDGKNRQNVWSKEIVDNSGLENIYDGSDVRSVIDDHIEDVTKKYFTQALAKDGKYIIEDGAEIEDIEIANMLYNILGGDIICLDENAQKGKMPDILWNGKYWEFKRPTTIKAIDARIRKAQEQLGSASKRDKITVGGMVIDISREQEENNKIIEEIMKKMKSRCKYEQDVVISKNGEIIMVLRYRP